MKNKKQYWYNLLNHFEIKGYFENGLTLPFIIGARNIIEEQAPLLTIQDLFKEFEESKAYINVLKCGQIGEYVFRIGDAEDAKIYFTNKYLIMTDECFVEHSSINDIVAHLSDRYHNPIEIGNYSRIRGEWSVFTNQEIDQIKEVKELED